MISKSQLVIFSALLASQGLVGAVGSAVPAAQPDKPADNKSAKPSTPMSEDKIAEVEQAVEKAMAELAQAVTDVAQTNKDLLIAERKAATTFDKAKVSEEALAALEAGKKDDLDRVTAAVKQLTQDHEDAQAQAAEAKATSDKSAADLKAFEAAEARAEATTAALAEVRQAHSQAQANFQSAHQEYRLANQAVDDEPLNEKLQTERADKLIKLQAANAEVIRVTAALQEAQDAAHAAAQAAAGDKTALRDTADRDSTVLERAAAAVADNKAALKNVTDELQKIQAAIAEAQAEADKDAAIATAARSKHTQLSTEAGAAKATLTKLQSDLADKEKNVKAAVAAQEAIIKATAAKPPSGGPQKPVVPEPAPGAQPGAAAPVVPAAAPVVPAAAPVVPAAAPVVPAAAPVVPAAAPVVPAAAPAKPTELPKFTAMDQAAINTEVDARIKTFNPDQKDAAAVKGTFTKAYGLINRAAKLYELIAKPQKPDAAASTQSKNLRRLAEKNEAADKPVDHFFNVIRDTAAEALTSLTQLQTKHGAKYEKVTDQATYNVFKTDVAETEAAFARAEAVIKLRDDNNSKAAELKSAKATALGLGLGLGLGIPVLVGVVFTVLVKTNRVLLNFGSTVSADV